MLDPFIEFLTLSIIGCTCVGLLALVLAIVGYEWE